MFPGIKMDTYLNPWILFIKEIVAPQNSSNFCNHPFAKQRTTEKL
jgi:hypothetical protein